VIRAVAAAVVVLIFSATAAFAFQAEQGIEVSIDVDPEGNSANSLGANDACISVEPGESFEIDITVRGVEPLNVVTENYIAEGLAGFEYNFHFDPAVVHVTSVENNFMLKPLSPFERIVPNYTAGADPGPLPATTGNLRVTYLDASTEYETGDGILTRLTLQAVGAGTTTLTVNSDLEPEPAPAVYATFGFAYPVNTLQPALISVGEACEQASVPTPYDPPDSWGAQIGVEPGSPTPTPGPATPSPTLSDTDIDEGDAEVSVDVVPEGNSATSLGDIEDCASADIGQVFLIDVVVNDVEDLIAFELPVTYNPAMLRIVGRDVKQFLAGEGDGQEIFDASNQTPNTTGFYRAGAVDQADPAEPDSGSGTLVRLTMEALSNGITGVRVTPVDQTGDGVPDTGVLLKNIDNLAIGGPVFRGPTNDAEIRVGSDCDSGAKVQETAAPQTPGSGDDNGDEGGGSDTWVFVVAGVAAVVLAAGGAAVYMSRRRRQGTPGGGTPPV
jgi:hypothetical protein